VPAAVGCAALLLIAGCGPAKSAAATAPGTSNSAGSSISAYLTCLRQHGVNVPTARPTAPPSAPASGAPRAGRFLNGLNPNDPKVAAAVKACQSKLPTFSRPPASASAA
jgi:hypothetical protein